MPELVPANANLLNQVCKRLMNGTVDPTKLYCLQFALRASQQDDCRNSFLNGETMWRLQSTLGHLLQLNQMSIHRNLLMSEDEQEELAEDMQGMSEEQAGRTLLQSLGLELLD